MILQALSIINLLRCHQMWK